MKRWLIAVAALIFSISAVSAQGIIDKAASDIRVRARANDVNAPGSATTAKAASTDLGAKILADLSAPFLALANFIAKDADGAAKLAVSIPNLQDTNGQACWIAMKDAGAIFQAHPLPLTGAAMTDLEALRLLQMTANKLCSNAACTVVFADLANAATQAAGAVNPINVPLNIPSLGTICAKIPQLQPTLPASATTIPPAASVVAPTSPATEPAPAAK